MIYRLQNISNTVLERKCTLDLLAAPQNLHRNFSACGIEEKTEFITNVGISSILFGQKQLIIVMHAIEKAFRITIHIMLQRIGS